MRVLEILGSLHRGGAETMIMNYYRAFDKELCQMDFVVHAKYDNDYRNEATNLGARVFFVDPPGKIGLVEYIRKLTILMKANGPFDAIHIHTNYQAFMPIIAAHKAGIPKIIVHSHNTFFPQKTFLQRYQVTINRLVFKLFSVKKLACGIAAGNAFFGESKFEVLPNAIDIQNFRDVKLNKRKNELFNGYKIIGHIGRFVKIKNHIFLIDVIDKLIKMNPKIILLLYGEGELEKDMKTIVKKRGLEKNIKFMGVTSDIATAYQMFDLFVLPSLAEGFPVTLIEAQLAGINSITSDLVSTECDLEVGKIQYLSLDSDLWAKKIHQLLFLESNKQNRENSKINIDKYDVNIQWKKLYQIYLD